MSTSTAIEWTDATWNMIRALHRATGKVGWHCEHVSPGCANCYAGPINEVRFGTGLPYKPGHRADIEIFLDERTLLAPLRWRRPRRIFPCSMSDLFHEGVPDAWIDRVFAVMALAPQHTFQVLTKRSARMRAYLSKVDRERLVGAAAMSEAPVGLDISASRLMWCPATGHDFDGRWPLPNVWLGVSAEDQQRADERVPDLLATPAAVRFVSAEPLLERLDLAPYLGPTGYTLGNPDAYEPGLSGGVLDKAIGGAFFKTGEAAASALENGRLPRSWFPDRDLPGRVYELRGTQHDGSRDSVGAARLSKPARIARVGAPSLDWVIGGCESGPHARITPPGAGRSLRDQCSAARTPFFWKQNGEWLTHDDALDIVGEDNPLVGDSQRRTRSKNSLSVVEGTTMIRVGRKLAGRLLDGVEHNGMPEARP